MTTENELPGKNARAMLPLLEELAEKDAEIARLQAAVKAEREACAAACERQAQLQLETGGEDCCIAQAKRCADDIRRRK